MSDATSQTAGNTTATGSAATDAGATGGSGAAAATAAAAPASSAAPASQSQQATSGQPASGGQAAAASTAGGQGQPAAGEKPAGAAPEKYEFKAPQGIVMDDATTAQFSELARKLNLPQEAAQEVIDKLAPSMAAANAKAIETALRNQSTQWADQVKADPEIGGEKLSENLAVVKKAADRFLTPGLRALLDPFDRQKNPVGTGLGNHPELVKLFHRLGKAISEDKVVSGTRATPEGQRDAATVLYGPKA